MICKITKGKGFSGIIRYVTEPKKSAMIIGGTLSGTTPELLAAEFRVIAKKNPRVIKPVEHISLSPSPEDRTLSDSEWNELAADFLHQMGLERNQYLVVIHNDTEYPDGKNRTHLHLIANRVSINGQCASDWQDWKRAEEILRKLEIDYHLTSTPSSWEVDKSADTTGQQRRIRREKEEYEQGQRATPPEDSFKSQLYQAVLAAAANQPTLTEFLERLENACVDAQIRMTRKGHIQGIAYRFQEQPPEIKPMSGSALGNSCSWGGLQSKLGVSYDPKRDKAAVERVAITKESIRNRGRDIDTNNIPVVTLKELDPLREFLDKLPEATSQTTASFHIDHPTNFPADTSAPYQIAQSAVTLINAQPLRVRQQPEFDFREGDYIIWRSNTEDCLSVYQEKEKALRTVIQFQSETLIYSDCQFHDVEFLQGRAREVEELEEKKRIQVELKRHKEKAQGIEL